MQHFKKSKYTLTVPLASAGKGLSGAYHTVSRGMILATEETLLRIINTNALPGDEPLTELLWEHGLLVPSHTDEDAVFEIWRQQHVHDCSTMRSKVVVTRQCNNRCRYCIVAPEATAMSHETARAMDRYYFKYIENTRPEKVRDEFTGGEPLLKKTRNHPLPAARLLADTFTLMEQFAELDSTFVGESGYKTLTLTDQESQDMVRCLREVIVPVLKAPWPVSDSSAVRQGLVAFSPFLITELRNILLQKPPESRLGDELEKIEMLRREMTDRFQPHRYFTP